MAETPADHVPGLISSPSAALSSDSEVSPTTVTQSQTMTPAADYFEAQPGPKTETHKIPAALAKADAAAPFPPMASASTGASTTTLTSSPAEDGTIDSRHSSNDGSDRPHLGSRKSSTASVTFRPPRNPSLPQGNPRKTDFKRLRKSSPSPKRFKRHVGFDNLPLGEATKNNPSSFTLQVRHQGYQPTRRSRNFMIGVDEHAYSDYALVWLLHNMVDDGDMVICVRVLENTPRLSGGETSYRDEAKRLIETIQAKNELNKAISITLEYSVGKLHDTFRQLVALYNPSMLIVGTKGRSLGGFQGLMNTRNSFSKYCLQYSPIPVVVVRPDDKRAKKKEKRSQDSSRHTYEAMLAYNSGKHEADSEPAGVYMLEKGISADEEAHRVAAAIGLPARFDPTIKPYNPPSHSRRSSPSALASASSTGKRPASPRPATAATESGDDDSGADDEEYEYEAEIITPGQRLGHAGRTQSDLERVQKERLHAMEMGEAAALLKSTQLQDDDDDDEGQERTSDETRKR